MVYALLFGALAGILALYADRARRANEKNIRELMRRVQESQQREMQRLSSKAVRPCQRGTSGSGSQA